MRHINAVFCDLVAQGIVLPYMNDLVISATTKSEALERLTTALKVASDNELELNFNKCQFLHSKIEFLGNIVQHVKLFLSSSKTAAFLNYPDPQNIKDVRRFLGLTGYLRKFIPYYSTIAKPLSDLLRKDTSFYFKLIRKQLFTN